MFHEFDGEYHAHFSALYAENLRSYFGGDETGAIYISPVRILKDQLICSLWARGRFMEYHERFQAVPLDCVQFYEGDGEPTPIRVAMGLEKAEPIDPGFINNSKIYLRHDGVVEYRSENTHTKLGIFIGGQGDELAPIRPYIGTWDVLIWTTTEGTFPALADGGPLAVKKGIILPLCSHYQRDYIPLTAEGIVEYAHCRASLWQLLPRQIKRAESQLFGILNKCDFGSY